MVGFMNAWWGRVFGDAEIGGNHTVIVTDPIQGVDEFALARRLGVPDTGFARLVEPQCFELVTYSPFEELAQCLQTSVASVVAFGAEPGERWSVKHRQSEPLIFIREGNTVWVEQKVNDEIRFERAEIPKFLQGGSAHSPVILRQLRSRIYVEYEDLDYLDRVVIDARQVLDICRRYRVNGLVLSAGVGDRRRVRVFTSSLKGHEDSATGGAILGLGQLLVIRGVAGELSIVQGPKDPGKQGYFQLRLDGSNDIHLGGQVSTLMTGRIPL